MIEIRFLSSSHKLKKGESFAHLPEPRLAAARGWKVEHLEANEQNAQRVNALGIDRVPTLIVLKDGAEAARCTGYQPEEILELWLDAKTQE